MLNDRHPEDIALIGTDSDTNTFVAEYSTASRQKRKTECLSIHTALLFACIVSILSFILNSAQLLSAAGRHHAIPISLPRLDVRTLQHPSLYLGLNSVPDIQASLLLLSQLVHPTATAHPPTAQPARPTLAVLQSGKPYTTVRLNSKHPNTEFPPDGWVLLSEEVKICTIHTYSLLIADYLFPGPYGFGFQYTPHRLIFMHLLQSFSSS